MQLCVNSVLHGVNGEMDGHSLFIGLAYFPNILQY